MSKEQSHKEENASLIKTPKQLAVAVILAFLVPIIIIMMLVNLVTSQGRSGAGSNALTPEAIDKRIAPVAGFELVDANAPKVFKTGEQVYTSVCASCHAAGVAGAPKVGDNAGWSARIKEGFDAMLNIALHGKGAMPPKGGNPALSDFEVARAVVHMANASGGSFPEPQAPDQESPTASGAPAAAANAPQPTAAAAGAGVGAGVGVGAGAAGGATTQSQQQAQAQAQAQSPGAGSGAPAQAPAKKADAAAPTAPAAGSSSLTADGSSAVNPMGEKLYKTACFACHASGVAGAPKFGDKAAWAPFIAAGEDAMVQVALSGKGAMPPKGGAPNASEDDIRAAVRYMVNAAK